MRNMKKIIGIVLLISSVFLLADVFLNIYNSRILEAIKKLIISIGVGCMGVAYLISANS